MAAYFVANESSDVSAAVTSWPGGESQIDVVSRLGDLYGESDDGRHVLTRSSICENWCRKPCCKMFEEGFTMGNYLPVGLLCTQSGVAVGASLLICFKVVLCWEPCGLLLALLQKVSVEEGKGIQNLLSSSNSQSK